MSERPDAVTAMAPVKTGSMPPCEKPLPLISMSIPVLNEAANLDALYARLDALSRVMKDKCDLEFVFSDNHSSDETWTKLQYLAEQDPRVKAIRFSRNFGFQRSILANYMHTKGCAVMQIDADLQDPPEMLEQFFELWKQGYQVVYGIRRKRVESLGIRLVRHIGYWLIDRISEYPIPRGAGDFRLIDRKVVRALEHYRSVNPYLRGMIAGIGFNQTGVPYDRVARVEGESKFPFWEIIRFGMTGVFNHSVVPLRVATYAGLLLVGLSFIGALFYFVWRLLHPELPHGIASILILILFGIGFQSLLLGILGEYLIRVYLTLRSEPIAIIEHAVNFDKHEIKL